MRDTPAGAAAADRPGAVGRAVPARGGIDAGAPRRGVGRQRAAQGALSLLLGPRDWSTEAAIVALARLARDVPWIAVDVHAAFAKLDRARADSGGCAHEYALLEFWASLPCMYEPEREQLRARLDALTGDEPG